MYVTTLLSLRLCNKITASYSISKCIIPYSGFKGCRYTHVLACLSKGLYLFIATKDNYSSLLPTTKIHTRTNTILYVCT